MLESLPVFLVAFGVAGGVWLFAATYTGTARAIWRPFAKFSLALRVIGAALTIYVMVTAGGIVFFLGLAVLAFGTLHAYFTRPDEDLGLYNRNVIPGPFRWILRKIDGFVKLLTG